MILYDRGGTVIGWGATEEEKEEIATVFESLPPDVAAKVERYFMSWKPYEIDIVDILRYARQLMERAQ